MTSTMMKTAMVAVAVTFCAAAQLSAVQLSSAQADPPAGVVADPVSDRAAELRAQAEQLFSEPKQWRRAARLLEQSAELRSARDPGGYSCLVLAGSLRAATGDFEGARQNYEKAANHAIARGAVVEAAHAYIDAAHAAIQARQAETAQSLIARAQLLTHSPLISKEQAHFISRRIA
jgi:hypothetical protein